MRIRCITLFDITATGVRSNFNKNRIPFTDDSGETIDTLDQWNRSRNRQRNWETMNQIISLRTLPEEITLPQRDNDKWFFEFSVANPTDIGDSYDPVGALKQDSIGVPMLTGLDEINRADTVLEVDSNVFFNILDR